MTTGTPRTTPSPIVPGQVTAPGRHRLPRVLTVSGSLQERFDPRRNHLSAIRLALAMIVAFTHALELGFGHQPTISGTHVSNVAVDAFFVLSGFLLAGSYLRLNSIRRYVWHRFLRIMPGFWVCLLVTALIIAPLIAWLQGRAAASVFTGPESALMFLLSDATLLMRQFGIAGLPQDVPVPGVLNGALWTLFYEALCYAAVAVLGLIGALRRRPAITLAVIALLWAATALNAAGVQVLSQERLLRFLLLFLIGSALFQYARRVPIAGWLAAASALLLAVGLLCGPDYRAIAAPGLAYLCVWCAVIRPPRTSSQSDLSYGLYVYHWPLLQVLAVLGLARHGQAVFVVTGLALALGAAFLSWRLIERPCLQFKDAAWIDPSTTRAQVAGHQ